MILQQLIDLLELAGKHIHADKMEGSVEEVRSIIYKDPLMSMDEKRHIIYRIVYGRLYDEEAII